MTAFLLQNLKLIMLFLLIGSVIGLANVRSELRYGSASAMSRPLRASERARVIFGANTRIASAGDRAVSSRNGKGLELRRPEVQFG